jgi:methylated-DNA-[protein]-cysteine S-methyltransferase
VTLNERQQARFESPIGWVRVATNRNGAVVAVSFVDDDSASEKPTENASAAAEQLQEYFAGLRREFDLELEPEGTEFERRVWAELVRIPYGETDTYGAIANRLGDHGASRAVGLANARNPIAVVVPCHRVLGSSGDLTGYAGGLWRKKWLLALESGQGRLVF